MPAITFPRGFTLYESRAICRYLIKKYSFPLMPSNSDLEASGLFDQARSVEMTYFGEPTGRLSFEKFAKEFMRLPANESVVTEAVKSLEAFFDIAERILQGQDYMAGKDFSLADIDYIPLTQRLCASGYGDLVTKRPAVNSWWERCVNRPAIKGVLEADRQAAAQAHK